VEQSGKSLTQRVGKIFRDDLLHVNSRRWHFDAVLPCGAFFLALLRRLFIFDLRILWNSLIVIFLEIQFYADITSCCRRHTQVTSLLLAVQLAGNCAPRLCVCGTARSRQPTADSPQPTAHSRQPAADSPQPTARSQQPAADSPQPTARSRQPTATGR
jgi:hypothetical protein